MAICFSSSLVVIDQFDVKSILSFKAEDDSPIGPYRHGPEASQAAFQRVQTIPREIQGLRVGGGIKDGEDSFHRFQEVGPYPASVAAFIETLQAAMLEAPNHQDEV
jgi:hypothetical protein